MYEKEKKYLIQAIQIVYLFPIYGAIVLIEEIRGDCNPILQNHLCSVSVSLLECYVPGSMFHTFSGLYAVQ